MSFLDDIFHETATEKEINRILLIDFSNILWATWYGQVRFDRTLKDDHEKFALWRYLLLNQISSLKNKFQPDEVIMAIDSSSWRQKAFQFYKAERRLKRGQDKTFNYQEFFDTAEQFIQEITDTFPYKVIREDDAEADDIIAILTKELSIQGKDIVIVSRDKDFKQLLDMDNVRLFDPQDKKFKTVEDPKSFLIDHILRGDSSDGIPNMLSDDNVFVNSDKRQKAITKKVREEVAELGLEEYAIRNNLSDNYTRNKLLIELTDENYPADLKIKIIFNYNNTVPTVGNYIKVVQFFKKHKIKSLLEKADQFL